MHRSRFVFGVLLVTTLVALPSIARAQVPTGSGSPAAAAAQTGSAGSPPQSSSSDSELPRFAVGVKAGSLGFGAEVGTALMRRVNVRAGFNAFSITHTFNNDGTDYDATLSLKSVDAKIDLYIAGGFHISPGVLLYNDNNMQATTTVAKGQSFTLGDATYYSSQTTPVTGTAAVTLNSFAPTLVLGFGNLLPRSSRHWSLSTDFGVVFQGRPKFKLDLAGTACAFNGTNCLSVASDPTVQANLQKQRDKVSEDIKPFQYYPDVTIMLGYKF